MNDDALRLEQISLIRDQTLLLDDVTLRFEPGKRTMLLGPNGAGKSVLLRLAHGLIQPTTGSVQWPVSAREVSHRLQAMVFQRPVLLRRSVLANIRYALAVHGIPWRMRRRLALVALEQVGLAHLAARPARVLSGGEQQRVALARAWALKPRLLFLDEPSASLDPGATALIEGIIAAIHQQGTTVVMATHDLGQARRHADTVAFLHKGRLVENSSATAFFAKPAGLLAQQFLAGDLLTQESAG